MLSKEELKRQKQLDRFFILKKKSQEKYLAKQKLKFENKENKSPKPFSSSQKKKWNKDKLIYKQVWDKHPSHRCEECGNYLGDIFEDENGKVIDSFRYSHILGKGGHPKLRHIVDNFNLFCFNCHNYYEFATWED